MDEFSRTGKVIGIVLDCSLRHEADGKRLVDNVKKSLIEFVKTLENGLDSFYLYHPELYELTDHRGEQVCSIGNYQTDGRLFNVETALKQTLAVLCLEEDADKYLFLITDRSFHNMNKIRKIADKTHIEAEICLIFIGKDIETSSGLLSVLKGKVYGNDACG